MSALTKNHAPLCRIFKVPLDFPAKSILRFLSKITPLSPDLAGISRTFEVLFGEWRRLCQIDREITPRKANLIETSIMPPGKPLSAPPKITPLSAYLNAAHNFTAWYGGDFAEIKHALHVQ